VTDSFSKNDSAVTYFMAPTSKNLSVHVQSSENVYVLPVVLMEMQQEKLPSMYSQFMKAAQDKSGLVIDDAIIKINREEEEETYGRGK